LKEEEFVFCLEVTNLDKNNGLEEINKFVTKMSKEDKTLRWTHFGTDWFDLPVRVHNFLYRNKETNPILMAKREYDLYNGQEKETLECELSVYQGLLSGRQSMINRLLGLFTLFLSVTAIIVSLELNLEQIITYFPIILVALVIILFLLLLSVGADRLTVREFHVRIIVLSHLIAKKTGRQT
jgi:hypothetical protein